MKRQNPVWKALVRNAKGDEKEISTVASGILEAFKSLEAIAGKWVILSIKEEDICDSSTLKSVKRGIFASKDERITRTPSEEERYRMEVMI